MKRATFLGQVIRNLSKTRRLREDVIAMVSRVADDSAKPTNPSDGTDEAAQTIEKNTTWRLCTEVDAIVRVQRGTDIIGQASFALAAWHRRAQASCNASSK